jgi:hypothetical protein
LVGVGVGVLVGVGVRDGLFVKVGVGVGVVVGVWIKVGVGVTVTVVGNDVGTGCSAIRDDSTRDSSSEQATIKNTTRIKIQICRIIFKL